MKVNLNKALLAAAALGAFSAAAHAQSSVTLYGSLDAGIAYVNNAGGHSAWLQSSSLLSNTYFGLKGAEDLGGGLKAIFKLESGFNLSSGAFSNNSTMFNRQAYVGIQSAQYGTFTLGKQYDSVVDYLSPLSLAGQAGVVNLAAHPLNNDNIGAQYSINNAVKYESANYSGFHFGGLYGFSNDPGQFANGRAWSVGAGYAAGPLTVAAAYDQTNTNTNAATNGSAAATVPLGGNVKRTFGVGANYAFGPGTAGVLWTHTRIQGATEGGVNGLNARFDNIEVNGTYSLTPALALVANYTYTYGKTSGAGTSSSDPKWHSAVLAADYSLSKRSDVYLAGAYQHASGDVYNNGTTVVDNTASIAGLLPASTTQSQVAVTVGMRHRF
ncbi:porin [Paraburkholderia sp. CNPSo 3274]|uniref:porin n=1 Tax=Paraburkholderia sp. CNPSo 3274 TaxID=2940932 RepID=UPI0020B6C299|nr:porin [Paraburkholderia sp. CNPSo 3274]MCP3712855.1 porin [Paraburkholderia sp. CNPSo 3274]